MKRFINITIAILISGTGTSQVPGSLITTPIQTFLNPDGNSWVTSSSSPYIANDQGESELEWTALPQLEAEVNNDLQEGASCGSTDILDDPLTGQDASYALFFDPDGNPGNGDEYFMYRIRIAQDPKNANFGFNLLIDIDEKFGSEDTDSTLGNPGFEVEIRVVNGGAGKGVYLDDVNGKTVGDNFAFYHLESNAQKSYALAHDSACTGNQPIFYDFMIPFSDLAHFFNISPATQFRMIGVTLQNGGSATNQIISDIAGVNGNNYENTIAAQTQAFIDLLGKQAGVNVGSAKGYGILPVDLLYFGGGVLIDQTILQWTTGTETNNDYFEVQKSTDGINFYSINRVYGNGNSATEINYSCTDYNFEGDAFYRLKQVDLDHFFNYSDVIFIKKAKSQNSAITLNSAKQTVDIKVNSKAAILFINGNGQVLNEQTVSNSTSINIENIPKGTIIIKLFNQDVNQSIKMGLI